jgi:hypothetical protein
MIFESTLNFIYKVVSTQVFWLLILALMGLGRWLLLRETLLFASKKENKLTVLEKKKRKRLLFWGKGLLWLGLPFMIIFMILSFLSSQN